MNMKLYERVREHIQSDTATKAFLNVPIPIKVWVMDEITCFGNGIYYWDYDGWIEWMNLIPRNGDDRHRIKDSLVKHARLTPCYRMTQPLGKLSTTSDRRYALEFTQIDSTFLPGYYIVSAFLWDNVDRDSIGIGVGHTAKIYSAIVDKDTKIHRLFYGKYIGG